ncbi:hypothetical protein EL77_1671 [Escherichia coli]|nr:hypothetical protein EL77_1671 [Escherichia coli]
MPEFLRPTYTLLITSALYMTGCGLHLPKAFAAAWPPSCTRV